MQSAQLGEKSVDEYKTIAHAQRTTAVRTMPKSRGKLFSSRERLWLG